MVIALFIGCVGDVDRSDKGGVLGLPPARAALDRVSPLDQDSRILRVGPPRLVPDRTIVVGGGASGMSAAMDLEGEVLLLDSGEELGGRALLSGGLMFMVDTETLRRIGITGTVADAAADWEALTGAPATETTISWLEDSADVHDRLVDLGVVFDIGRDDPILSKWWLHIPYRGGPGLVDALVGGLPDSVEVHLKTQVIGLRFLDGRVAGVETGTGTILGDNVVLATGGYVNRLDLLDLVIDDEVGTYGTGDDRFAQGDAIDWAGRFGLATEALDAIGWGAGLVATPGAKGTPIRIETHGVIPWVWVDDTGRRFVDESQGWSVLIAGAERRRPNVWAVGDWERWVLDVSKADLPYLEDARAKGEVIRCDPDETVLAGMLGVADEGLRDTLGEVAELAADSTTDTLGRASNSFAPDTPVTLCGFRIGHEALKSFGGLRVSESGQVIDIDGDVVPGLWSVGEAAGMASPGMGGLSGWDGSLSAVVWGGWRTAAAINARQ